MTCLQCKASDGGDPLLGGTAGFRIFQFGQLAERWYLIHPESRWNKKRQIIKCVSTLTAKRVGPPNCFAVRGYIEVIRHFRCNRRQPFKTSSGRSKCSRRGIAGRLDSGSECSKVRYGHCSSDVLQNACGISNSFEESRPQDWLIGKFKQTAPQCQEMAREVAAVHRRDIKG